MKRTLVVHVGTAIDELKKIDLSNYSSIEFESDPLKWFEFQDFLEYILNNFDGGVLINTSYKSLFPEVIDELNQFSNIYFNIIDLDHANFDEKIRTDFKEYTSGSYFLLHKLERLMIEFKLTNSQTKREDLIFDLVGVIKHFNIQLPVISIHEDDYSKISIDSIYRLSVLRSQLKESVKQIQFFTHSNYFVDEVSRDGLTISNESVFDYKRKQFHSGIFDLLRRTLSLSEFKNQEYQYSMESNLEKVTYHNPDKPKFKYWDRNLEIKIKEIK